VGELQQQRYWVLVMARFPYLIGANRSILQVIMVHFLSIHHFVSTSQDKASTNLIVSTHIKPRRLLAVTATLAYYSITRDKESVTIDYAENFPLLGEALPRQDPSVPWWLKGWRSQPAWTLELSKIQQ
jgi:hypothetical protein